MMLGCAQIMRQLPKRILIGLGLALALASDGVFELLRASTLSPAITLSSAPMDHVGIGIAMAA